MPTIRTRPAIHCLGLALGTTILCQTAMAGERDKVDTPPLQVERTDAGEAVLVHEGEASFYGPGFHGRKTATGERFNQNKATAASRELPLGSKATVTNQDNGKSVDVIINDRGPYVDGRVIDLSRGAARKLDMIEDGLAPVRVEAAPSEQPNDKAREKVESKAEKAIAEGRTVEDKADDDQVATKPADETGR